MPPIKKKPVYNARPKSTAGKRKNDLSKEEAESAARYSSFSIDAAKTAKKNKIAAIKDAASITKKRWRIRNAPLKYFHSIANPITSGRTEIAAISITADISRAICFGRKNVKITDHMADKIKRIAIRTNSARFVSCVIKEKRKNEGGGRRFRKISPARRHQSSWKRKMQAQNDHVHDFELPAYPLLQHTS